MKTKHLIGCTLIAIGSALPMSHKTKTLIVLAGFVLIIVGYLLARGALDAALYRKSNFLEAELPNGRYSIVSEMLDETGLVVIRDADNVAYLFRPDTAFDEDTIRFGAVDGHIVEFENHPAGEGVD